MAKVGVITDPRFTTPAFYIVRSRAALEITQGISERVTKNLIRRLRKAALDSDPVSTVRLHRAEVEGVIARVPGRSRTMNLAIDARAWCAARTSGARDAIAKVVSR